MRRALAAVVMCGVFLLVGCGGSSSSVTGSGAGGGASLSSGAGSGAGSGAESVSLQGVMQYVATYGLSGTCVISGWSFSSSNTVSGTCNVTQEKGRPSTFSDGSAVFFQSSQISGNINAGQQTYTFGENLYLDSSSYTIRAEETIPAYIEFQPYTNPSAISAGAGGILTTGTLFSDSGQSATLGTAKLSYSVAAGSGTNLLITFITDYYDFSNNHVYNSQTTYQVSSSGTPALSKLVRASTGFYDISLINDRYNFVYSF